MDDFYAMYKAYKDKNAHQPIADTEWGMSEAGKKWLEGCDKTFSIEVVGVFDAVSRNVHFIIPLRKKPTTDYRRSELSAGQTIHTLMLTTLTSPTPSTTLLCSPRSRTPSKPLLSMSIAQPSHLTCGLYTHQKETNPLPT